MVLLLSKTIVPLILLLASAILRIKGIGASYALESLPEPQMPELSELSSASEVVGQNSQGPWPECIGKSGPECVTLIESQAPDLRGNVRVFTQGSIMTMDYRTDRVRVLVDDNGVVIKAPQRG